MKHRDWLHLKREGENVCAVLRLKGYQCHKLRVACPEKFLW